MATLQNLAHVPQVQLTKVFAADQLAGQVNRLVKAVEELSSQLPAAVGTMAILAPAPQPEPAPQPVEEVALETARQLLSVRRKREKAFGAKLFCDPAWDILVELYVARSDRSDLSVGDACIASGVPLTSALRCCQALQKRNLVRRERDPHDRRRIFLRLTDGAFALLTKTLAAR